MFDERHLEGLSPQGKLYALREIQKEIFNSSLYLTAKELLGYKDVNHRTHGDMIQSLEEPTTRKLIVMPRGTFKSSVSSVAFPIWCLNRNPDLRILLDGEVYTNSKNFLREIRMHLEAEPITSVYGPYAGPVWNESEIVIRQRKKVYKEASITASGIGAEKTGQHYDCLVAGTLILTSNGYLPVEAIQPKMRVLSSDGKFHSVVAVQSKHSDKPLVGLRAKYQPKTNWMTEDHLVCVFRDECAQWVMAKDVKQSDFLATPRIKAFTRAVSRTNKRINTLITEPDVWRFIGYWLAEGSRSTSNPNAIRLIFGETETDYIQDVCDIAKKHFGKRAVVLPNSKGAVSVKFSDPDVKELLAKFGSRASNKHLPPFALNASRNLQREMLIGYWRGDGSVTHKTINFSSISLSLLTGVQLILARFGIQSGITQTRKAGRSTIVRVDCNISDAWNLNTTNPLASLLLNQEAEFPIKPPRSFFTDNFWWVPVSEIKHGVGGNQVYDIQVADVHDFYSPGMILHNCIICDDLNSPTNSNTPEGREKVINHYKFLTSILEPTGTLVIVGTRYSALDVPGFIIENEINFEGLIPKWK